MDDLGRETSLDDLVKGLRLLDPRVVLVCGAQRSGTTIATHILAQELNYAVVDEEDYGTKDLAVWKELVLTQRQTIIHSPAMSRWVHEVATQDVAVVWILRPAREVEASIRRINWQGAANELAKYNDTGAVDGIRLFSQVKNDYWRQVQAPLIENSFEIQYRNLSIHPLFLAKKHRAYFSSRQWRSQENMQEVK